LATVSGRHNASLSQGYAVIWLRRYYAPLSLSHYVATMSDYE